MPFQSEKQRRYLWANEPEIARDWADTYGSRIEKNDGGRIPAAFGGIMDTATGRRAYGFGSIFKSIKKAASKVLKSPVGKAAIMYGLGTYLGGTTAFGGTGATPWYARWKDPKLLANLIKPSEWTGVLDKPGSFLSEPSDWKNKLFMKYDKTKKAYDGLSLGKAAIYGSTLLPWMLPGPEEDDEGDKGSTYDLLNNKYAQELMNIKSGLSAGSLNPDQWSYLPSDYTYTGAEGGRAGYYAGGQSTPSDYTMEDAMMTTTQDKLGGITDVMKQADLYRQGSVGQMYAADGGRIGFAGGMNEKLAELKKAYDTYTKGGGTLSFEQFSIAFAEENFAQGGRIGYDAGGQTGHPPITMGQVSQAPPQAPAPQAPPMPAPQPNRMAGMHPMMRGMNPMMGGRRMAQEGGLMDLGGMEKDYRQEGGFVPLGGEEKADDVPARLSKNEFVFTADAVRGAGDGDIDKGAEIMENIMNNLEQGGQISEETQGLTGAQEMFGVSERLSEVV
jgi:hypothetical protein